MHIAAPEDAIHMDAPECFLCLLSLLGYRLSILRASHRLGMALSLTLVTDTESLHSGAVFFDTSAILSLPPRHGPVLLPGMVVCSAREDALLQSSSPVSTLAVALCFYRHGRV